MDQHPLNTWISSIIGTSAIAAALVGFLPSIAAGVAAIWYLIQIWESETVKRWRSQRRVVKLARLKARVIMLEAHDRAALPPAKKDDGPGLPAGY